MRAARTKWPTQGPAGRIAWEQLAQPIGLARRGIGLLHSLAYVSPALWPGRTVVTIHDLSFVLYRQQFRPLNRWYLSLFTRLSARRANAVIAVSESTRRDALRLLGLRPEQVRVVYSGVDAAFHPRPAEEVAAWRRSRHLPDRFILFLGTLEPRKNIAGLLEAYHLLETQWKPSDGDLPLLVIAGAKGWYYDEIFRKVAELGLQAAVRFPGYVPAEELPAWYRAAEAFVYPSLYEGFGLPVLEAMACGTAVITSDRSALPEVVGDAGLMVDPQSPAELGDAMRRLLLDDGLRAELAQRGCERAAGFTWRRTAEETLAVYQQVLSDKER